jgi:hypothetical protein
VHCQCLPSCVDEPNDGNKARGQPALAKRKRGFFPVALIGLFGAVFRFYYFPLESILEILKALRTDPVIIIRSRISFFQMLWIVVQREHFDQQKAQ